MTGKTPRPADDDLTSRLRQEVRKKRLLSPIGALVLLLCCCGPLAFFAWLVVPRPVPPPIALIAFDECAASGAPVTLHAQVVGLEDEQPIEPEGIEVVFEETQMPPGKPPRQLQATTDATGAACVQWPATGEPFEFVVRYVGGGKRKSTGDRARAYRFPVDSELLVVAIETLTPKQPKEWQGRNILDIKEVADCGAILTKVAGDKTPIIYLAAATEQPLTYRKMRAWLGNQFRTSFPKGPVLGRILFADNDQVKWLTELKAAFKGATTAVLGDAELATALAKHKIRTILLGADSAPQGVIACPSWKDLHQILVEKNAK